MAGPAPAQPSETAPAEFPPVVILTDDPTPVDELGNAHSRVATAIAVLVRQGLKSGRSIALTGSWGSGKSSVIEMLRGQLEQQNTPDYEPSLLLFDAWANQGDPLRRAFLERFIEHAILLDRRVKTDKIPPPEKPNAPEMTLQEIWSEELDLVTGRREKSEVHADRPLTTWGLAVAISLLFCLPLGGVFLGQFDKTKFFWTSNFAWLAMITYAIPILVALIAWLKDGRKADTFKSLLLREATEDTTTTTVKTREPSSVDFQRVFATIAGHLLKEERRRLIIVVDNLDRIDAASAVSMWATMRIFFEIDAPWKKRVWLIVPFDRTALSGLWQSADGKAGNDFVDSFLNKTFQIAFHVSPAVLTTWKKYFSEQLEKAFSGKHQERDRNAVFELFALKRTLPSPREIKIFINKISVLRLQWASAPENERIELPFLAAYVLHQNEIGVDGAGLLTGNVLTQEVVNILTRYKPEADCGGKLAAAHFNVPPDQAIQVLMGNRFSEALAAGNSDALSELSRNANFWTVFEGFSRAQTSAWQEPLTLVRVVKFLERSESEDKEPPPAIAGIWPIALKAAASTSNWGAIDQERAEAFPIILSRAATQPAFLHSIGANILGHLTKMAEGFNSAGASREILNPLIGALRGTLAEVRKYPASSDLAQGFLIKVTPQFYIAVSAAPGAASVLPHFTCSSPQEVPTVFADMLSTMEEKEFLRLKSILERVIPTGWDAFDTYVVSILAKLSPGQMVTAIRSIFWPRAGRAGVESLLKQVSTLALQRLGDSGFEENGKWKEAGVLAIVGVLGATGTVLSDVDAVTLRRVASSPPIELLGGMADALSEFGLSSKVLTLNFSMSLGEPLVESLLSKGRFDELAPETVIISYSYTSGLAVGPKLVEYAASSANFLAHFSEPGWTLAQTHYKFLADLLPKIDDSAREDVALRIARMQAALPVDLAAIPFLTVLMDASGIAWLPKDKASSFLSEIDERSAVSPGPSPFEIFKKHLENRIALGDRTAQELLDSAETSPPSDRDHLRDLAIDRARADFITAEEDKRRDARLVWGRALLARGRRGPWPDAKPFAERAQQILEMAPKDPRDAAGWAEAEELLSRPLTDKDALTRLNNTLGLLAFQDPGAAELIAEAVVRISRSRRITSPPERVEDLDRAQHNLEAVPEPHRSEFAWMQLAVCLTERAIVQPATRSASLDEAKKCAEYVYKKNPNAAHALRQLGFIALRAADYLPWQEAEPKLNEAQRLLDQARSLDPSDYFSICISADVLLQLAERRSRQEAKELVRVAKERYTSAAKLDSTWPNAFVGLGSAELFLARRSSGLESQAFAEGVITHAGAALKQRPDSYRAFRLMGNSKRVAGMVASRDTAEALFEEAFTHFEEGNKCRPNDYFLLTDWAMAYIAQAGRREAADARQSLTSAREKAETALSVEPNHPYAHVALGDVFGRLARLETDQQARDLLDQARLHYQKALGIAPDLEGALVGSARVAARISELAPKETRADGLPEAEELLRRSLKIRPDNERALEVLGDVQWRQALDRPGYAAALESARESYDQARKIDDQLEHSHLRVVEIDVSLAKIFKNPKRMADAIETYRAAVRQFPDRARAHFGLGKALELAVTSQLSTGDPALLLEEGIAAFRQASTLDPRNIETYKQWRTTVAALAERQSGKKDEHLKEVARLDETIARLTTPAAV